MRPEERTSQADRLRDLARSVRRLTPDHRDPEKYHVDKDSIAVELGRLAREIEILVRVA